MVFEISLRLKMFAGQNWGIENFGRLGKGIEVCSLFSVIWGVGLFIISFFVAPELATIFSSNVILIIHVFNFAITN